MQRAWLSVLKLCEDMGTHPGKVILYIQTGYPNPQGHGAKNVVLGSKQPNPCVVCWGLDVAVGLDFSAGWGFAAGWCFALGWGSEVGWGFEVGWDFVAGVENAQGKARYPS